MVLLLHHKLFNAPSHNAMNPWYQIPNWYQTRVPDVKERHGSARQNCLKWIKTFCPNICRDLSAFGHLFLNKSLFVSHFRFCIHVFILIVATFRLFLGKTTHLSRISKEAQLPKLFGDILRSPKVSQLLTPRITKPRWTRNWFYRPVAGNRAGCQGEEQRCRLKVLSLLPVGTLVSSFLINFQL